MSKAERRKRSRERQRQREAERQRALSQQEPKAPTTEVMTAADVAASEPPPPVSPPATPPVTPPVAAAPSTPAAPESPFITGPVRPPAPRRSEVRIEESELIDEPVYDEEEDADLGEEDDGDDGDDGDDDLDDDGEDEDDDEEALELEDCLFEVACGAVEEGPKLGWPELCAWLAAVDISDPRLALLIGLLCENDTKLTGERVLSVLEEMELGELVTEARELVAEEAAEGSDPEERAVVRTTSRELKEQAEKHLGGRRDDRKPVKSTQLRRGSGSATALSALGGVVSSGGGAVALPGTDSGGRKS